MSTSHGDRFAAEPSAEDYLRLAMAAEMPADQRRLAVSGVEALLKVNAVGQEIDSETQLLLLRELFKATVREGHPRSALAVARKMVRLGVLSEVAHADLGRACSGLRWYSQASQGYRLAARYAPATRRALHWSSCGLALWHAERHDEAIAAMDRAIRWSTTTRALHVTQVAMIELSRGNHSSDLKALITDLALTPQAEGYGRFVLGWIHHRLGNADGVALLQEFLRRNEHDPMRASTLRGEIEKAHAIVSPSGEQSVERVKNQSKHDSRLRKTKPAR